MGGVATRVMPARDRNFWNAPRYVAGSNGGHYESWFQRANHPDRPLAFWIRYTMFHPAGASGGTVTAGSGPAAAKDADQQSPAVIGELWAIFFDGERDRITTVKNEYAIADCRFACASGIDVTIGAAQLTAAHLEGSAATREHEMAWSLAYESPEPPLLLLPEALYERSLPKAKALVGSPNAVFHGRIVADGEEISIDGWTGSQNHNWGSRHTDSYAWGQVAGFDNAPDAFLECSTAQLRFGPIWTPRLSLVVLRTHGREYAWNSVAQALRARGRFSFFEWRIESAASDARIVVNIEAPRHAFAGLRYRNPPGGSKTCLNTKIATCRVTLERRGFDVATFVTRHRSAFEILTDRVDHGVDIVVGTDRMA